MLDRDALVPLPTVDVLDLLGPERAALCDLLEHLSADDWSHPTECPAWTVHGVALHVLGDDLSLLSRQRDAATPSLFLEASLPTWDGAPEAVLDRFNERWVDAATYLSPRALVDLLRVTGAWTHEYYAAVDPDSTGEPVMLFGLDAAPYRLIAAREYVERWVHQLQIRRAVGAGSGPLGTAPLADRAYEVIARALATLVAFAAPPDDAAVTIDFGGDPYTYLHAPPGPGPVPANPWFPHAGAPTDATVTVTIEAASVVEVVSRGLERDAVATRLTWRGDPALGAGLVDAMAGLMSAYYPDL